MSRSRYVITAIVAAVSAAVAATGIATAATSSSPLKACATSKGYLKVVNATNACPSGSTPISINKTGPRGLSPVSVVIDRTTPGGSATAVLPGGDTVSIFCGSNNGIPTPFVEISHTGAAYYVHGSAETQGGVVDYIDSSGHSALPGGHSLVAKLSSDYFQFAALATSSAAYGLVHALVNNAADVFTLDISIYSDPNRCQITVEATPAV